MRLVRTISPSLALTVRAVAAPAQEAPAPSRPSPSTSLGLTLGWGAPYGWGLDVRRFVTRRLELNAGVGVSTTGTKVGIGATYYLAPERRGSPFFGAALAHSGGRRDVYVHEAHRHFDHTFTSSEAAHVNFLSANLVHLRSGWRWQATPGCALFGILGYSVVLGDDPVEYLEAPARQSLRDAVRVQSPGGLEISMGLAWALSRRSASR